MTTIELYTYFVVVVVVVGEGGGGDGCGVVVDGIVICFKFLVIQGTKFATFV